MVHELSKVPEGVQLAFSREGVQLFPWVGGVGDPIASSLQKPI